MRKELILFGIVALIVASYFLFSGVKDVVTNSPTPTPGNLALRPITYTTDWNTFIDTSSDISFKYHPEMVMVEESPATKFELYRNGQGDATFLVDGIQVIYLTDDMQEKSLIEYVTFNSVLFTIVPDELAPTFVSGFPTVIWEDDSWGNSNNQTYQLFIEKDNQVISISFTYPKESNDYLLIRNSIINSIAFLK